MASPTNPMKAADAVAMSALRSWSWLAEQVGCESAPQGLAVLCVYLGLLTVSSLDV